jgi:hypothetical protein
MKKLASPFQLYLTAVIVGGLASLGWVTVHDTIDVVAPAPLLMWVLFV